MSHDLPEISINRCDICENRDDCLRSPQNVATNGECKFRRMISVVPMGIGVNHFDVDFTKVFANKGYYDVLGFTEQEFLERFPNGGLDAFHPDDREMVRQTAVEQLRANQSVTVRTRISHKTKGYIWVQYAGRIATDQAGLPLVYVSMTDISELMAANEKLEKEHNFNTLIASLSDQRLDF